MKSTVKDKDTETLLAVQLLTSDDESQEVLPATFALKLTGGQEMAFTLMPDYESNGEFSYAHAEVTYRETQLVRSAHLGPHQTI